MRTLTEVFTPAAPTLPEGLRTLVVSPERELEPGMTVRARFTFRNQGGALATGVRVRFSLPEGLVYLVGSGQLEDAPLDDEQGNSPLLARSGAQIGDLAPGEERRLEIAYSVAGAIENGSTIELQAAVAAFELPPVGSNVVRLVVRSKPALQNALTSAAIEGRQAQPHPGGEATVTVRVHNAGESSARDLVVVAPIPEHTEYVANSARVNGRELERDLPQSFDRMHAPVILKALPASATATLTYRVRIDDPLPDATPIVARAQVASQETAAFDLDPASLAVHSAPDFSGERTSCAVEPAEVVPGAHLTVRLNAVNEGSARAQNVAVAVAFPEMLVPVRGSTRVDGRALRERKKESASIDVGAVPARGSVEFITEAVVVSPIENGTPLPVNVTLTWAGGERIFECSAVVRSQPFLSPRHNRLERSGAIAVRPGDECEATIVLANEGSAAATGARLQLHLDPALDDVRVSDRSAKLALDDGVIDLGAIEPYATRRLGVRARVRNPYPDRSAIDVSASLHANELGETELGHVRWRVDSHPAFSSAGSRLELATNDVLRPNQLAEVRVLLRNEGTDAAQNVRLRLYISPEARLESVEGATRERATLLCGEIPAGARVEARLGLRLMRSMAKEYPLTIDGVLSADAMVPVQLEQLTIATTAEPDFSVGAFGSEPSDSADVGETIEYVLHLRNGGDGCAHHVNVRVEALESLIYVPNSTNVNDVPVRDVGARSPLSSERGIVLNDVDPGVEVTVRWRDVVHNGLRAGETLTRAARVEYDGERVDEILCGEIRVRATPVFANSVPGLPFGLDGMVGPALAGDAGRLAPGEHVLELPTATPVSRNGSAHEIESSAWMLSLPHGEDGAPDANVEQTGTPTLLAFTADRLERMLRFLDQARFPGLVSHLFAIRAFLPDAVGDDAGAAIAPLRETLRQTLDRLFIKLRLPHYTVAPRDVDNGALRAAVEGFLERAARASGVPAQPAHGVLVLHGALDPASIVLMHEVVGAAPPGTAAPWQALTAAIPAQAAELRNYRAVLGAALDDLVAVDADAFADALARRPYPVVDAALDVVRTHLATVRA